jgi:hypothetical protein
MNNQVEEYRLEATDEDQGGLFRFDWASGDLSVTWDDGSTESWANRGHSVDTMAESFYRLTEQYDRMCNV